MTHHTHETARQRVCRDTENGVILGVCAGLARRFDMPVWLTRLAVLALGWFFPAATLAAYLLAAWLMPPRRLHYCGDGDERRFWQRHGNTEG